MTFALLPAAWRASAATVGVAAGATGGTVIHARGTSNPEAAKIFGIVVQPEKEIVMIVVEKAIKDNVLHALYKTVGVNSECGGIAFALPIDDVVGIGNVPTAATNATATDDGKEAPAEDK